MVSQPVHSSDHPIGSSQDSDSKIGPHWTIYGNICLSPVVLKASNNDPDSGTKNMFTLNNQLVSKGSIVSVHLRVSRKPEKNLQGPTPFKLSPIYHTENNNKLKKHEDCFLC